MLSISNSSSYLHVAQRALLDNLPFLAWMKDKEGCYIAVNRAFTNFAKLNEVDIIGKKTGDVWDFESAEILVSADEIISKSLQPFEKQLEMLDENGEKRVYTFCKQPIISESGEFLGSTGFRLDITERKRAEEMVEHRAEFQSVLMELAVRFVNTPLHELDNAIDNSLDMMGNFADVDRVYIFKYDFPNGIMINTHEWCAEDIHPEKNNLQELPAEMFPDWVSAHLVGDMTYYPDVMSLPEDNAVRQILEPQCVLSIVTLPLYHKGECFGFVGFDSVKHIKEWDEYEIMLLRVMAALLTNAEIRRNYEQDLLDAKIMAESASMAKSEFLANMSHEIRTPLHGVVSMVNLLKETPLNKEQHEFLDMAETSAESLLSVINDILDFSKIEAGKLELVTRVFNLEEELTRLVSIISSRAKEKKIELLLRYELSIPRIFEGDNFRLRQILTNLLSNAIKFTDEGYVLVNIECLGIENSIAHLQFSVEDTGIGIQQDKLSLIFEQFSQVDSSSTRKYEGTGLGLTICKSLVKLMGGNIVATSTVGKGSVFKFDIYLPCHVNMQTAESPYPLVGKKALIVDDIAVNRRILSEYLTSWGVEHDIANNALSALRYLNHFEDNKRIYDFIVLDQAMPGMDGVELSKLMNSNKSAILPKIILMTSMWGLLNREQASAVGIDAIIPKPVTPSDLLNAIRDCLFGYQMTDKVAEKKLSESKIQEQFQSSKLRNVLVVDDRLINRKAAAFMIEKLGYKVYMAENGVEALDIVQTHELHMVFMDVQMPVMDGYEACKAIRALGGKYEQLPIIALTANALDSNREYCLQIGMNDYLAKPLDKEKLIEVLEKYDSKKTEEAPIIQLNCEDFNIKEILMLYGNDEELAKELLSDFLSESYNGMLELKTAVEERSIRVENLAHRFKGPCSYVGANKLREISSLIMNAVTQGYWELADAYVEELTKAWMIFADKAHSWILNPLGAKSE